jgi:surface antigen
MRLQTVLLTICLSVASTGFISTAEAARSDGRHESRPASSQQRQAPAVTSRTATRPQTSRRSYAGSFSGGISCVPYARSVTGMEISGDGREWWHNAAGRYARGQRPELGSILSFPGSGGMGSGHVAVVSRVAHNRMIEIDHANWGGPGIPRGTVMRNIRVLDVSDDNSWTRVRVQSGWNGDAFGREYPTHGFIHNRPASSYAANEDMIRPVSYTQQRDTFHARARR